MVGIAQGSLGANTTEGQHGKTSIQEFAEFHAFDLCLRLSLKELHWVKTEVTRSTVVLALGNFNENGTSAELNNTNSNQHECHGSLGNEDVVRLVSGRDAFHRVDFTRETERDSESTVGGDPTEPGQHANAAVLELGLSHPVESWESGSLLPTWGLDETSKVLWDAAQVERVEANITNQGSVKVGRSWQERKGFGSLGLVDHGVPHALRHGLQFGGTLGRGSWGKRNGPRSQHSNNGKRKGVHGQSLEEEEAGTNQVE
jgi:hypothetical protein